MINKITSDKDFEEAIIRIYREDEIETNNKFGFRMHLYMKIERCQRKFWEQYHMTRPQFLNAFSKFFDNRPVPNSNETNCVSVQGGTSNSYTKRSWVIINEKKYVFFRIDIEEYNKMRKRGEEQ